MRRTNFFCYLTTNVSKTVIYTGMSNDLPQRLTEHYLNRGKKETFAGRYHCYNLVYFERFLKPGKALERENQIKGWTRKKKVALIESVNPTWKFLNEEVMPWPPDENAHSR